MGKYIGNEKKYFKQVLKSEFWSSTAGSWNKELEAAFAKKFQSKYAVAFNSGTSTLHAALLAVGVKPGDEVISPGLTVIMDTAAIIHANAIPVYADIDSKSWIMDPKDLEKKITPKTKAIIVVSLYGMSPDMDEIMRIARKNNIPVIEDNAQSFLAEYKGKLLGTMGDIASYSFESSKHASAGEGGIVITNNEKYAETMRKIGNHGFKNSTAVNGQIKLDMDQFQDPDYKRHDRIGYNYRLSEFQAAVALAQLENIDLLVKMRQNIYQKFVGVVSKNKCFTLQNADYSFKHASWTFGVLFRGEEIGGISWKDFYRKYVELGGDGFYAAWSVPYLEPAMISQSFAEDLPQIYGSKKDYKGCCPVAESVQPKIMQFKTNYFDEKIANVKIKALENTINFFESTKTPPKKIEVVERNLIVSDKDKTTDELKNIFKGYEWIVDIHNSRRKERDAFVVNLIGNTVLRNKKILSVNCGLAGEESLIAEKCGQMTLMDSDGKMLEMVKKIYAKKYPSISNVEFLRDTVEKYSGNGVFDIIYSSSSSDWMFDSVSLPPDYCDFINNHLSPDGFCVLRMYGGRYLDVYKDQFKILEHVKDIFSNCEGKNLTINNYFLYEFSSGLSCGLAIITKGKNSRSFSFLDKNVETEDGRQVINVKSLKSE